MLYHLKNYIITSYSENLHQINNVLLCKHCKLRLSLDEPKILPCVETIRSKCEKSIQVVNENKFNCLVCNSEHEMPNEGLAIN